MANGYLATGNGQRSTVNSRIRLLLTLIVTVAVLASSCGSEEPQDDLEYLVREVCRQVRIEGVTADQVSGTLHDAARHGAVMGLIEVECGDEIAAVYSRDP